MQSKQASLLFLLGLSVILTGCGGGGGSSSSSTSATPSAATIMKDNGLQGFVPGYQIVVSPSGAATYTVYSTTTSGQPVNQTGTVTLPATLTSKFYQDLAAAGPLSKLPPYTGALSSQTVFVNLKYQGQQAEILGTSSTQAQALNADCTAIAQAVGIPQSAIDY